MNRTWNKERMSACKTTNHSLKNVQSDMNTSYVSKQAYDKVTSEYRSMPTHMVFRSILKSAPSESRSRYTT